MGSRSLEHLPGNVGYLDLRGFSPPELEVPRNCCDESFANCPL